MAFFTSLTGINAATAAMGVTSNNIANAGTTGFKKSSAEFGDIFATSPLQKASTTIGQGVSLKDVSLNFGQGNVSVSSNTLDMAISGSGFFPLLSNDGLQKVYTRDGTFVMNDQNNVVNASGEKLLAASVDSTGKADTSNMNPLTIPQQTTGQAKETTAVSLGLNLPANADVITGAFNRNDPKTYNYSTAVTVYDKSGNGYLATVYYAKTQNASQSAPTNRWQTYVYVGDTLVKPALQQALDPATGQPEYVNKYGQLAPLSQVSDQLVNKKTEMFALTDLTDTRTSAPASVTAGLAPNLSSLTPVDFSKYTPAQLQNLFQISLDGSPAQSIGLENLAGSANKLDGNQIAAELTNVINAKFGNQKFWNFTGANTSTVSLSVTDNTQSPPVTTPTTINLLGGGTNGSNDMTNAQTIALIQSQLDAAYPPPAGQQHGVTVAYDASSQQFTFTPQTGSSVEFTSANPLMGLNSSSLSQASNSSNIQVTAYPQGNPITALANQRYGATVSYDNVNQKFVFSSGTTGDNSSVVITPLDPTSTNTNPTTLGGDGSTSNLAFSTTVLGLKLSDNGTTINYATNASPVDAVRGIPSLPAIMAGSPVGININQNFAVDTTNNTFVVSVDNVKGTVVIPPKPDYTLDSFTLALQDGINRLVGAPSAAGLTGPMVSGVKVAYDNKTNAFTFTSGTTGTNSYMKVSGDAIWGLSNVTAARGSTTTWIKPTQKTVNNNGTPVAQYIDSFGNETSSADGFSTLPQWSPVYLNKGELTFNTSGNLVSPTTGAQLSTVYLPNGAGSLTMNINYSKSTQFSSPYAVLSQSQDGAPEGSLVGVAIGTNGLVQASYSNGSQQSLGKVVLVNFSNPSGLQQIGNSSFYASSSSGSPKLGEAGSAGYGTVQSGATENSNVDLTQELVNLITEQRNFQANAKAIETDTTLTQTIIQIRS